MTWRDKMMSSRIAADVVEAIDAYPLLLPVHGIEVSAGFVEMQPGSMGSFPVITITLNPPEGGFPSITAIPENGWAAGRLDVRKAVWKVLEPLADGL